LRDDIKTGLVRHVRDEPGGSLLTAQVVSGLEVARARFGLWCGTWEPVPRHRGRPGEWRKQWPVAGRESEPSKRQKP